jgi:glycosyltransferase involved in cell wall biosynthesis
MDKGVTLTIGIPTYNGSAFIRDALDSVIRQISGELSSKVDILVSDNGSTDGTPGIIKSYQESQPVRIHYTRNDVNIGYDRNVDKLFKNASGKFIWILADDDVLTDGALLKILELLGTNPGLKAVMVNFDKYDRTLQHVTDRVVIDGDKYCRDAETFLRGAKARYNLVSSLIFNKSAWNEENIDHMFGSNFIHVYVLFRLLLRGDSYIVHEPLIKMRMGSENSGTDGDSLLSIALDSGAIIRSMRKMGHRPDIIRWLFRDVRKYTFRTITVAKLLGIKKKSIVAKKLVANHNGLAVWFKYLPIIYCPDSLFRRLYFFKKGISSKTRVIERSIKGCFKKVNW